MADDGFIPVDNLPIDTVPMEESAVYNVTLDKAMISPKLDKAGMVFAQVQCVVADGDYEGRTLAANWLPLPMEIPSDMRTADKKKIEERIVTFSRFCRSFKITTPMPKVRLDKPETRAMWQDWIEKAYGNSGKVTIQNQMFNGRQRASINDFIF